MDQVTPLKSRPIDVEAQPDKSVATPKAVASASAKIAAAPAPKAVPAPQALLATPVALLPPPAAGATGASTAPQGSAPPEKPASAAATEDLQGRPGFALVQAFTSPPCKLCILSSSPGARQNDLDVDSSQ